jgi:uncharacterized protein YbjT (DUF2867 family)
VNKPKILVTGATGKTGGAAVAQLRAQGYPVRAVVRTLDARAERLAGLGAEITVADLFDYDGVRAAMEGTSRAYFCPPWHPQMLQSAVVFALAAREAKLESIVGLTQWLASPDHRSLLTRHHWLADRLFELLPDTALTIVNPGFFADEPYLSFMKYAALLGIFPMPARGDSRNAPPSADDIARVAVAALVDPAKHAGKTYRPTGPELLSLGDMVAILGDVLGRKVRPVNLPFWMFYKAARMDGFDSYALSAMKHYLHELDAGTFALDAPNGDVLATTGREPESFETIARRYAALPQMQPTFGNRAHALAQFLTVPFRPGLDVQRYGAQVSIPVPPNPLRAFESDRWKREHARALIPSSNVASAGVPFPNGAYPSVAFRSVASPANAERESVLGR